MIPPERMPAVVIGGGVIGSAAAYYLAQAGIKPIVLERDPMPAQASVRNAGGVRAQCRSRVERLLAMRSIDLWAKFTADTGDDLEYHRGGNLRLALKESGLKTFAAEAAEEAADGLHTEIWDRGDLRRRAPYLSPRFAGAKYCASDGHANPILATWAMTRAAARAGAVMWWGARAEGIETRGRRIVGVRGSADGAPFRIATPLVIHAAGPWTSKPAADLGLRLPLTPARNAILVTQTAAPLFGTFVSSHELEVYMRQARAGQVHIGGVSNVLGTFDQEVTTAEIASLARACEVIPELGGMNVLRVWSGTLDMTPDHLPIIGRPAGIDGYIVAAGFSGHGFCLSPAVGRTLCDLARESAPGLDISALSPDRFSTDSGTA
ncbi:FAD-binding oxidoreductase [Actinomadura madurae]|uniref:NAD(P)/FAD-dependent oxidoreductase n=1 Tax=Actinomadura madurae TaxID=1993 RepID=UPI00202695A6|nr:FAD-binding oxidoreductase [Actinomadura madurae]URN03275.1 FAD-binding oxidoreductase [Actinomadura madurae]